MSYVKLDDKAPEHTKILTAGPLAGWLWTAGLAYCNRNQTNGFIPISATKLLIDVEGYSFDGKPVTVRNLIKILVEVALWEACDGGYLVHDYLKHQTSKEQMEATKEARIAAGHKGGVQKAVANGKQTPKQNSSNLLDVGQQHVSSKTPSKSVAPLVNKESRSKNQESRTEEESHPTNTTEDEEQTWVVTEHPAASASEPSQKTQQEQGYSQQFEGFWIGYPRRYGTKRGSKADAWGVFKRLSAKDRQAACDALPTYCKLDDTKRENGRYIPDAVVWLRGKRWQTVEEEAQAELQKKINGGARNGNSYSDNGQQRRHYPTKNERFDESLEANARLFQAIVSPEGHI